MDFFVLKEPTMAMSKRDFLYWEQSTRDVIAVRMMYVDLAGDVLVGLMLSQIIYWHLPDKEGKSKLRVQHDGQLWLAKTYKEWNQEIRFSERQIRRSLSELEVAGIIEQRLFKFNGCPTVHVRVIWDALLTQLDNLQNAVKPDETVQNDKKTLENSVSYETSESNPAKRQNPILRNVRIQSCETSETITETTAKNTTESTLSGEPDDSLSEEFLDESLSGEDETHPGSPEETDTSDTPAPGHLFSGKKKTTQEAPDIWFRSAQDFYERLLAKNKIMRRPNLKQWAATLKEFIDSSNVTREEFREIRLWYCTHIGEEHVPEAYSMEGFCEKFVRIKAARQRTLPQQDPQKKSKNMLAAEEAIRRRREQADE